MLFESLTFNWFYFLAAAHGLGLVVGFGGVLALDFVLLNNYLSDRTTTRTMALCHKLTRFVIVGQFLLWISGFALLFYYYFNSPEKLQNPTLYVKLFIVSVLTLNSLIIHQIAFPITWKYPDRHVLASVSVKEALLFAVCISVSFVSWCFPVIFSLSSALNAQTSASNLLGQYLLALLFLVPFACAITVRAMWASRASSLLTYHGKAATTTTR